MTRPVVIEFRADDGSLIRSMKTTGDQANRLAGQLDRTGGSAERMGRNSERSATQMSKLQVAAAATAVALGVRVYARVADEMATMNARLALATNGQQEFNQAQADVSRIANENGRQLTSVSELYTRLSQSLEDYDGKATDVATITQTVTQAMRVSGTSAAESSGAIRQLSQAFASGVLRGDEFNSVNEQAPRIMQALADSLGVTRGELRAMAEQGELTSDILRTALIDEAGAIAEESAQIPQTLGEAWTTLGNSVMELIGAFDGAAGSSQGFAGVITGVADRIGTAADWIRERALAVRLAGIAMVRGTLLAFEELSGGFRFVQGVYTEFFALLGNEWNRAIARTANAVARILEIQSSVADIVPGMQGVADGAGEMAASLRQTADEASRNIVEVNSLGEVHERVRAEVNANKEAINQHADSIADYAIETANAAKVQGELNDATREANEEQETSVERSEELIGSIADLAQSLAEQTEKLREETVQRAGGTQALMNYRIAKLAAAGATQEEIAALEELRDGLIDQEQALEDLTEAQKKATDAAAEQTRQVQEQADWMAQLGLAASQAAMGIRQANEESARFSAGDSIARSVASAITAADGRSLGESIATALAASGADLITQSIEDAISAAFESGGGGFSASMDSFFSPGEGETGISTAGGATIGSIAGSLIGNQMGGDYADAGSAIGSAIGTAIMPGIGTLIGGILGGLAGGLIGGKDPIIQSAGANTFTRSNDVARLRGDTVDTELGEVFFRFRGIEDAAQQQLKDGIQQLDSALAGLLDRTPFFSAAQEALEDFQTLSQDPRQIFQERFDTVLSVFDAFTQDLVRKGQTLEDDIQRLDDSITIGAAVEAGRALGLTAADSLDFSGPEAVLRQTLTLVDELAGSGETLNQAFERLRTTVAVLDTAALLAGTTLADTRIETIRFADALVQEFAGGLQEATGALGRIFDTFFSDAELAETAAQQARDRATDLLESIGIEATDSALSQSGFRELFDGLFGSLGPEETAILIQAGAAIADLIDAESALAQARGDTEDATRRAAEAAAFIDNINAQLLDQIAPAWASFDQLTQSIAETWNQAQALGLSEEQLMRVRQLAQAQLDAFIASTGENIERLRDQFTGQNDPASLFAGSVENTAQRVQAAAGSINSSITNSLESIRDWLDREVLSETSNLAPEDRLTEARAQFEDALASGNIGDLTRLADQLLGEGADFYGRSSGQFDALRDFVRGSLEDLDIDPQAAGTPTFGQTAQIVSASQATSQATGDTARFSFEQVQAANELISQVALMAQATGRLPSEIGAEYDLPMRDLIAAVTGELPTATGEALESYFNDLVSESQNELTALLDLNAAQTAQQASLDSIDRTLRRIADLPTSDPTIGQGGAIGAAPIEQVDQTIRSENAALRDELRGIRQELAELRERTEQGNRDRRQLVAETAGVGEDVRASGDRISREIRETPARRRGAG